MLRLEATEITKRYERREIFRPVSLDVGEGDTLAITGPNGSGKSTLLKILGGVLSPTRGTLKWWSDGRELDEEERRKKIGFVSPYLELYGELTAIEHIMLVRRLRRLEVNQ